MPDAADQPVVQVGQFVVVGTRSLWVAVQAIKQARAAEDDAKRVRVVLGGVQVEVMTRHEWTKEMFKSCS